jgi:Right handed beta helix region
MSTLDRMLRLGAIGALLTGGLVHTALANSFPNCSVIVDGQNNAGIDPTAVSAAVNQPPASGDVTVCLRGVFDFGTTYEAVLINPGPAVTSLRVVGINGPSSGLATIRNGILPFLFAAPATLPSLKIENLRFEQAAFTPVGILVANGYVRVAGLQIAGVQTYAVPSLGYVTLREGIVVSAIGPISGQIDITGNVVDGGNYSASDLSLGASSGIEIIGGVVGGATQPYSAQVHVWGNQVSNWSGSGISVTGTQNVIIERNSVTTGRVANLQSGCMAPNGLGAANGISLAADTNLTVRDNVITLVPARTTSGGVPACTTGITVAGLDGVAANGNLVYHNQIRGTANYGLLLGTVGGATDGSTETDDVFALNSLLGFSAQSASLYLGAEANGNVLVGYFASVGGNAAGNVVIGTH